MKGIYVLLLTLMLVCIGCQWQLTPGRGSDERAKVGIQRYDRIEALYLTTGDLSAIQQLNTSYPMQTRALIEDVLRLGRVNDAGINGRFLRFFQDTTLQCMLAAVQRQYADMSDVSSELDEAFRRLREALPALPLPEVYAQIGSFDQSIIVCGNKVGVSLDKYLGADYPFYRQNYPEEQRRMMVRSMIVPDCLSFYLLNFFPLSMEKRGQQTSRDRHMGRIQWVVNQAVGREVFVGSDVTTAGSYMRDNPRVTLEQLLREG